MSGRHRPRFIGRDPEYSGARPDQPGDGEPADHPAPPEGRPWRAIRDEPIPHPPPPLPDEAPSPPPADRHARAPEEEPAACINVHLHLGHDASERLAALGAATGDDPADLLRWLRRGVVDALRVRLAQDDLPDAGPLPRDGLPVRVQFTLRGAACRRARARLDPLGLGDHVLRQRIRPVLAMLYADRIGALGP